MSILANCQPPVPVRQSVLKRLWKVLRVFLSLALIVLVARQLNWAALLPLLATIRPAPAIAASICTLLLVALLAQRWNIFLSALGMKVPAATLFRISWAGQFFNLVTPGSVGGDGIKLLEICRRFPSKSPEAATTVVADRLAALITLCGMAGVATFLAPFKLNLATLSNIPWRLVLVSCIAVSAIVFGLLVYARAKWPMGAILANLQRLRKPLTSFCTTPRIVLPALALSLAIHLLNFTIIFGFSLALSIQISFGQVLIMMPVVLICLLIPVTINGHGLREVLFIGYFTQFGVTSIVHSNATASELTVALTLLLLANDLLVLTTGGLLYILSDRRIAVSDSADVGQNSRNDDIKVHAGPSCLR